MQWDTPTVYAVKHNDLGTRMASRSGGIFSALSDAVLNDGGVVYGCVLNETFEAIHIRAKTAAERNRMRGSKYIQSNMGDIFRAVAADLKAERRVLFSGTSCQVAGLKAYLGREDEHLFCVDIVCHGVPSPLVWKKYLDWQRARHGEIHAVDFRNKLDFGWADHVETLYTAKGKAVHSRVFTTMFYGHCILRPCCYQCPYKDTMHPGDITIADYWGVQKAAPGFSDNKGVSLVLVNNDRGAAAFEAVQGELTVQQTRLEDSLQPPLIKPFDAPKERDAFWNALQTQSFDHVVKTYGTLSRKVRLKKKYVQFKRKIKKWLGQ